MAEKLHRFCRTHACVYVQTSTREGQRVYCFQDFRGRRLYVTEGDLEANRT